MKAILLTIVAIFGAGSLASAGDRGLKCSENHYGWKFEAQIASETQLKDYKYGRADGSEYRSMGEGATLEISENSLQSDPNIAHAWWFDFMRDDNFCKVTLVIPRGFSTLDIGSKFPMNVLCDTYTDELSCEIQ